MNDIQSQSESGDIAVGDELAFSIGYGCRWEIIKIERFTSSGLIKCGRFTLNPDLTIRGRRPAYCPLRGEPVTDEIRREVRRQGNISKISAIGWNNLTNEQLEAVVRVIRDE